METLNGDLSIGLVTLAFVVLTSGEEMSKQLQGELAVGVTTRRSQEFFTPVTCRVDMVLVGAEGVVENGGVINKLGTYNIALAAAAHQKSVYVAAESYKVRHPSTPSSRIPRFLIGSLMFIMMRSARSGAA